MDHSPYFIIFHFKLTLRKYFYFLHFLGEEMEAQKIKYFTQYLSQQTELGTEPGSDFKAEVPERQ